MDCENRRVENHTDQLIFLPPMVGVERERDDGEIDYVDFPKGIRLQPGLNTVPKFYLEALDAKESPMFDAQGAPRKGRDGKDLVRYPGREAIAMLIAPVTYTTASGRRFGARVTVHADPLAGRADGPQAPATLPDNQQAALAFIAACDDTAALQRWHSMYGKRRPDLGIKLQERLATLRAGKAA